MATIPEARKGLEIMIQDKKDIDAASEIAEEAAFIAEKAAASAAENAANAAENATLAADSAEQARGIADAFVNLGGPSDFIYLLAIFALAIFVGYYVVWSVTPALHTPLMSVTNAISSVVIVGALIALGANLVGSEAGLIPKLLGFMAVILASINIFGGFMVTQRMLAMYKKKEK